MDEERQQRMEERQQRIKERQQRIADVLNRAADDPRLRQQLLDDPRSLLAAPDDTSPPLPAHIQDMRRQIVGQLVDRASADPQFRVQLSQDLREAVRVAGLTPLMEQLRAELPANAEVVAYSWGPDGWGEGWGWGDGWGGWG